jgi:hypothetical protein
MLERHKKKYHYHENYMGDKTIIIDPGIRLQQIVGVMKKY